MQKLKLLLIVGAIILGFWGCRDDSVENVKSAKISAYGVTVDRDKIGKQLNIFIYPDYLPKELVTKFENTYGIQVVVDYYDNNDALLAKLQAGGLGQYDLVCPSDYAVSILKNLNLLQKIDHTNIPNLKNLAPRFRNLPYDPLNEYAVPYQWGTTGLGIRSDLVDTAGVDLHTWDIVFKESAALGPFTMLDDSRETIGTALKYLGYSLNTTNPKELAEAEQLLLAQRKRVLAYAPSSPARDYLISGDAVVVHNYSGDVFMGQQEVPAIIYVIPREGGVIWTDNLAIPAKAPNKTAAELFINFILDPENGAALTNFTRYASPNEAALPFIEPAIKNNPGIFTKDPALLDKLEYIMDVGEAIKLYNEIWIRVKSAGN